MDSPEQSSGDMMEAAARMQYGKLMTSRVSWKELIVAAMRFPGKGVMAGVYEEACKDGKGFDFLSRLAALHGTTVDRLLDIPSLRSEAGDSDDALIDMLACSIIMHAIDQYMGNDEGTIDDQVPHKDPKIASWVSMLEPWDDLQRKNPTIYGAANRKVARVLAAIGMSKAVPESTIMPEHGIFSTDGDGTDATAFLDAVAKLLIDAGNSGTHAFAAALGFPSLNPDQLEAFRRMFQQTMESQRAPPEDDPAPENE